MLTNEQVIEKMLNLAKQIVVASKKGDRLELIAAENALNDLIAEKTQIIFDGSYKPNEDEILKIENYQLSDEIKAAVRDPLGVPSFKKDNDAFPEIKAIFVGERTEDGETEKFNVVFQRFRKEQYILTKWCNLFF